MPAEERLNVTLVSDQEIRGGAAALSIARYWRLAQRARAWIAGIVASKGAITLTDQAVASATNFITGVIVGRACTKEEFGLYMLGFSLLLVVLPLQSSLILGPYSVYSPRLQGREHAQYTGSTLIHQAAFSVLTVAALLLAGLVIFLGYGPRGLDEIIWALALTGSLILFREYARQVSFAQLGMMPALVLDVVVGVLQIGGLLLMAHFGNLCAGKAFLIMGAACGATSLVWLAGKWRGFALRLGPAWEDFRRNWSFGKWLFAGRLVYAGSNQLYPWFVAFFCGTAATGVLAACMGTIFLANPFIMGMGNFLGPKAAHAFVKGGRDEVRRVVRRDSLIFTLIMCPFCLVMILFGDHILALMYGAKYGGHGLIVGVLALSQMVSAITLPTSFGLNAIERPDVGFKSSLIALASMLALGLWMVKYFGPIGVAFGLLAGNAAISVFRWVIFHRLCPAFPEEGE